MRKNVLLWVVGLSVVVGLSSIGWANLPFLARDKQVMFTSDPANGPNCRKLPPLAYTLHLVSTHALPAISLASGSPYISLTIESYQQNDPKIDSRSYVEVARLAGLDAPITINGSYIHPTQVSSGTWSYGDCKGRFTSTLGAPR